ncbi:MAG: DUF502 domain-containing protein [Gammaproteobacteria bacterium]|nr:DUF502 domain-containing protein [Gammaproteobacteria bacterium]
MINTIYKFLFNAFFGGFIIILPIIVLYKLAAWLFSFLSETAEPITRLLIQSLSLSEPRALGFTLAGTFIFCALIGLLTRTRFGKAAQTLFETRILSRIPGYNAIRDIIGQITGKQSGLFRGVVLVTLEDTGVSATGFIVDEISDQLITVFIPCGPNPTTGFVLHMNRDKVTRLNVSVEAAMKTIIACGSGSSQFLKASTFSGGI